MNRMLLAVTVTVVGGCAAPLPLEQQYARLSWAKVSVEQAQAECWADVQRNPMMGFPVCMQAKGWQERR